MAVKKKKHEDIIAKVNEELEKNDNIEDEEYEPELRLFPTLGRKKTEDEIAIDEMLVGLKGNDWYLKLSKEVSPNEWQFKKRINQFRHWADMEYEVNCLIRAETEAEHKRIGRVVNWGSGRYMITFFRNGGLRGGEKKQPVIFNVDAQEKEPIQTNSNDVNVELMRELLTKQPEVNPVDLLTKGMEIAVSKSGTEASGSNTMMTAMMTLVGTIIAESQKSNAAIIAAIVGRPVPTIPHTDPMAMISNTVALLKDTGVVQKPETQSLVDQVNTLKALGLLPDKSDNDPQKQFSQMKTFMDLALSFARSTEGERPSLVEKAIEVMGPKFADTLNNLVGMAKSVAEYRKAQIESGAMPSGPGPISMPSGQITNSQPRALPIQNYQHQSPQQLNLFPNVDEPHDNMTMDTSAMDAAWAKASANMNSGNVNNNFDNTDTNSTVNINRPMPVSPITKEEENRAEMIRKYSNQLYQYVSTSNYGAFDTITQIASTFIGGPNAIKTMITSGQVNADQLVMYILMLDKDHYTTDTSKAQLIDYVSKYVSSFSSHDNGNGKELILTCQVCGQEHEFDNEAHYEREKNKQGGTVICNENGCEGVLA